MGPEPRSPPSGVALEVIDPAQLDNGLRKRAVPKAAELFALLLGAPLRFVHHGLQRWFVLRTPFQSGSGSQQVLRLPEDLDALNQPRAVKAVEQYQRVAQALSGQPEDVIAIVKEELNIAVARDRFAQLLKSPSSRRMSSHVAVDDLSGSYLKGVPL